MLTNTHNGPTAWRKALGTCLLFAACSAPVDPKNSIVVGGGSSSDKDESSGNQSGDGDGSGADGRANVPQQVSGAFLTCAYWEPLTTVKSTIQAKAPVDLGCGLFRRTDSQVQLADLSGLAVKPQILCADNKLVDLPNRTLPATSNLNLLVSVAADKVVCTVQLSIKDANSTAAVAFRKSITTIGSDNAKQHFDINADLANQGLKLDANGTPVSSNQGAQQGGGGPNFLTMAAKIASQIINTVSTIYGATHVQQLTPPVQDTGTTTYISTNSGGSGSANGGAGNNANDGSTYQPTVNTKGPKVGGYTCEQQKSWGKCSEPWMHPTCNAVCGTANTGKSQSGTQQSSADQGTTGGTSTHSQTTSATQTSTATSQTNTATTNSGNGGSNQQGQGNNATPNTNGTPSGNMGGGTGQATDTSATPPVNNSGNAGAASQINGAGSSNSGGSATTNTSSTTKATKRRSGR